MVTVAVVGATMVSSCFAQNYPTGACQPAPAAFGYPVQATGVYQSAFANTGCGHQGCGGAVGGGAGGCQFANELRARSAHAHMIHDRIAARNQAWPKPFDCADRQLYFSIWEPMIDQGFEEQCVLTAAHFDPSTNQLNRFGKHAVAGIMQNMPTTRRTVFIHRDNNHQISELRRDAVRETIETFYSNSGPANIAYSQKRPVTTHGLKAAAIQDSLLGNLPTPVIPISSLGQDVNSSVGGGN